MSRILVIPSIRPESLAGFLAAWEGRGGWDSTILIEDNPLPLFDAATDRHYAWDEIDRVCGKASWVFSRRDSGIRSFGFLMAWWQGAQHVLTLDDDTRPHPGHYPIFDSHLRAMRGEPRWRSTVPGMRVRGLPYRNPGVMPECHLSIGLWSGVPDLDAATTLVSGCPDDFTPPPGGWVVPRGQYVPTCGMNLCARREAIPLLYFGLMGQGQPFARFDDIFMGVWAKKVCDHLGWSVRVGPPFVHHTRASDPFVNLRKEAAGVGYFETFWEKVDAVRLTSSSAAGCMGEIGEALARDGDEYTGRLGRAVVAWAEFFRGE